jgi:hypothetical protein
VVEPPLAGDLVVNLFSSTHTTPIWLVAPSLRITGERWIDWTPEKQLQILPLRVRMTAVWR